MALTDTTSLSAEISPTIGSNCGMSTGRNQVLMECVALDHVLLSGGTTFQGRGWYNDVCPTMKAGGGHGVMYMKARDSSPATALKPAQSDTNPNSRQLSSETADTARPQSSYATGGIVKYEDHVWYESGKGWFSEGFGCLRSEGENRPSRPAHVIVKETKE